MFKSITAPAPAVHPTFPPTSGTTVDEYRTALADLDLDGAVLSLDARIEEANEIGVLIPGHDPIRWVFQAHYSAWSTTINTALSVKSRAAAVARAAAQADEDAELDRMAAAVVDQANRVKREESRENQMGQYKHASLDQPLTGWEAEYTALKGWAANPGSHRTVVLYGPTGTGKTVAAYATGTEVMRNDPKASIAVYEWTRLRDLVLASDNGPRAEEKARMESHVHNATVLIINDLGSTNITELVGGVLSELLEHRNTKARLLTIVTLNIAGTLPERGENPFTPDTCPTPWATRVWSRFAVAYTQRWDGTDKRLNKGVHQ